MVPRELGRTEVALRAGQGVATYRLLTELMSRRGTFVVHQRFELVAAGNGFTAGTGTWSVVLGTGAYEGLTGSGRLGCVITASGMAVIQLEGFVRQPDR